MAIGSRARRAARRRNLRASALRWAAVIGAAGLAAWGAYSLAAIRVEQEMSAARAEILRLQSTLDEVAAERDALDEARAVAELNVEEWRARYEADTPKGAGLALWRLLSERLAAGVSPERLDFMIRAAEDGEAGCSSQIETLRALVVTGPDTSGVTTAEFADGAIIVTVTGAVLEAAAGADAGRYDPNQPVTASFLRIGGDAGDISGPMPLFRTERVADRELRFSVTDGGAGYAAISARECAFAGAEAEPAPPPAE